MKSAYLTWRLAGIAAASICIAPMVRAQTPPVSDAANGQKKDTVIVAGLLIPLAGEAVGETITIIPASLSEQQGYVWASDALRQVPGLHVSRLGAPGALTQVRIRGAEANHTLVLFNGIDISSPATGETDFSGLMTAGLDRIETMRGPQSGLYGSNALAGVINILPRSALEGGYRSAALEAGALGARLIEAGAGAGDENAFAALSLAQASGDGYDVSPDQTDKGVPAVGAGGRAGDREGHSLAAISAVGALNAGDAVRLEAVLRQTISKADLDGQAYSPPIAGRAYDDASRTRHEQRLAGASLFLDPFAGAWRTRITLSRLEEERRNWLTDFPFLVSPDASQLADLPNIPLLASGTDAGRLLLNAQSSLAFGQGIFSGVLTGFAEHRKENYADAFSSRREERSLSAVGLHYRAEIASQLFLAAALRRDDNDRFQDATTWSLSASLVLAPAGARLHASAGKGVTNPTFIEQFGFDPSTFIGNPDLLPEEATGWDAGVEQTLFDGRLRVEAVYFSSRLKNEIYTAFLPSFETTARNAQGRSERAGWEILLTADPVEDISVQAAYTRTRASEPAGPEIRRPANTASLDASWKVLGGPLRLNLGLSHSGGGVDIDFGSFMRAPLKSFTLARAGASYQLSDTVEIYGRIENLLGETYEEVLGYRGAPRGAYIGIRFREGTGR